MYKKLVFILFAVLCFNGLTAQSEFFLGEEIVKADDAAYRVSVGPKLGVGLSFGSYSRAQNLNFGLGLSFQGGAALNAHFGRRYEESDGGTGLLGLQLEALYESDALRLESKNFGVSCLELPILAQYYIVPSFGVEAGVTVVVLIGGSPDKLVYENTTYCIGELKGTDLRPTLGLCYKHPSGIMIDARYNMGTSPLAGNFDTKVSSVLVSFVYLINIIK